MSVDQFVQDASRLLGSCLQATGAAWTYAAETITANPFLMPFAENVRRSGQYMLEKGRPVESLPWYSSNEEAHRELKVSLRCFRKGGEGQPVLFVPPEAGHDSHIVDYGPGQSLVECALKNHSGDIYVMEKLPATAEHRTYSLDDCIRSVEVCADAIGRPVHLIGLCQGGWQSAVFAAFFPGKVASLTLAAAPIDFHAGDAAITAWARSVPFSFYESMVQIGCGNMPGAFILQGFMMLNAMDRFCGDDLMLYQKTENPKFIGRSRHFNSWYRTTQAVPGKLYLQIVKDLFRENRLVKKTLRIQGRRVDLSAIDHPLFLVAGEADDITPSEQLFALAEHVSSKNILKASVPAGHIGVFMGSAVVRDFWPGIFRRFF